MKGELVQRKTGAAIRRARLSRNISQEAFADQIGMHRTYYGAIERGERNLTLGSLARIAEGLGLRMSQLLGDASL